MPSLRATSGFNTITTTSGTSLLSAPVLMFKLSPNFDRQRSIRAPNVLLLSKP